MLTKTENIFITDKTRFKVSIVTTNAVKTFLYIINVNKTIKLALNNKCFGDYRKTIVNVNLEIIYQTECLFQVKITNITLFS